MEWDCLFMPMEMNLKENLCTIKDLQKEHLPLVLRSINPIIELIYMKINI